MERNKNAKRLVITSLSLAMAASLLSPVEPAQAAKVKFNVKSLTITVGNKKTLKLKNTKKAAKWSVKSGKDKIKLQKKKKTSVVVAAKKAGSAKVMAKIGKKKYLCSVKVKAATKKEVQNTDTQSTVTSAPTVPQQPTVPADPGTAQPPTADPGTAQPPTATPGTIQPSTEVPNPSASVVPTGTSIPAPNTPVPKNADDVKNLQTLIETQNAKGAQLPDCDDETVYKWNEEGRLTEIYWGEKGITAENMDDFNNFPALEKLDVNNNNISGSFSVNKLEKLKDLRCYGNQISGLSLDSNKELVDLDCHDNPWLANPLNLKDCKNLRNVYCSGNKLSSIDLSGCENLEILDCHSNSFEELNLSNLPNLKEVYCAGNNLKDDKLNLTGSTGIVILDCSLNASGDENLKLNLQGFTELETLNCSAEYSEEGANADEGIILDLSDCAKLKQLNCSYAAVSEIKAENLQNLETIEANGCGLVYIQITGAKNLKTLNIEDNSIEELTFPEENAITALNCNGSPHIAITNFEVLTKLQTLDIADSTITNANGLDFSKCVELKKLNAYNVTFGDDEEVEYPEELPSVDVDLSANVALEDINFFNVNVGILTLPLQDTVKNLSVNSSETTEIKNCEKQVGLLTLDIAGADNITTTLDLSKNENLKQITCLEAQKKIITGVSKDIFHIVSEDDIGDDSDDNSDE